MSNNPHTHQDLHLLRNRLAAILDGILHFIPPPTPIPILDASLDPVSGDGDPWVQQESIPGLKVLRESVERDLMSLDKFLGDPKSASLPPLSTNAPYLISVWNQLLLAPRPIISVFKTVYPNPDKVGSQKSSSTKVDIVAANGKQWFRVNTIKNSRFMAELREIDSYMTDSDTDNDGDSANARPKLAQTEFDNSVLRMGRDLLRAAEANPINANSETPVVTMRLTRLTPDDEANNDPRIIQTITMLRDMGITVELGEQDTENVPLSLPERRTSPSSFIPPVPTLNINLDLSIIIALISDLTHAPLPNDPDEAQTRFIPPRRYREWKKQRMQSSKKAKNLTAPTWDDDVQADSDLTQHSRALTNQVLLEMGKGLVQDIHDRLSVLSPNLDNVLFWTTPEARDRALRIVGKIGGSKELRRIKAMFPPDDPKSIAEAEEQYWSDSRYPRAFIPLLPIRILPSDIPGPNYQDVHAQKPKQLPPPFFQSLAATCQSILKQELTSHPNAFPEDRTESTEIQRALVTKANPRLTAHTVQSMLWGAQLGWTVLTANRSSVKAILKEIRSHKLSGRGEEVEREEIPNHIAAFWVCDPKSLGEQMRSDEKVLDS